MGDNQRILVGIAAPEIHIDCPADHTAPRGYTERAQEFGYHSLRVQEQSGFRE